MKRSKPITTATKPVASKRTAAKRPIRKEVTRQAASRQKPAPVADSLPAAPPEKTIGELQAKDPLWAHFVNHDAMLMGVYRLFLKEIGEEQAAAFHATPRYIMDMLARFKAQDVVEEMLISQMVQAHMRVTHFTVQAFHAKTLLREKAMSEAAERATNTFRRQMLALSEYRNPKRPRVFNNFGQANIAEQQVVQNNLAQGNTNGKQPAPTETKVLPHAEREEVFAGECSPRSTVAAEHRPQDPGRQTAVEVERPEARPLFGGTPQGPPRRLGDLKDAA